MNDKTGSVVWIINPYGNIPGEGWRDYRSTLIAKALVESGHKVIWWVSNFEHRSKKFRTSSWLDIQVNPSFLIRIVPSSSYNSHISLARIRYERLFASRLCDRASKSLPPDVIILAEPAIFISYAVIRLIRDWKTKLVIDILDLWPELFYIALPAWLSWAGKLIFFPLYMRRAALFRRSDAIVGATKDYLHVARKFADKTVSRVIYLGVDVRGIQTDMLSNYTPTILGDKIKNSKEIWVIYAGTLGNNYDIKTILHAAEHLAHINSSVKILIAGDGPLKNKVLSFINERSASNLIYFGPLSAKELTYLYRHCDIALSTYIAGSTVSMPLKAYDYMAAGLPIINSLNRELGQIIREKYLGLQYKPESPVSLANAINMLAENLEMRKTMSANASHLSLSFNEADQHSKFVDVIEAVMVVSTLPKANQM